MHITREAYDLTPLLIKQGALTLWGIPLTTWIENGSVHHLYQLNNFYADMCFDEKSGRLAYISTFSHLHQLVPCRGRKPSF
ncbi:hypothetical protein [Spirosoma rigui]|uniref:hypothetical protein n=1 Tax=Spirosoma rigui TaxID=564064 RepID=UPI0009B16B24|nr:hypothetical protein [Spirosoma rigui]